MRQLDVFEGAVVEVLINALLAYVTLFIIATILALLVSLIRKVIEYVGGGE